MKMRSVLGHIENKRLVVSGDPKKYIIYRTGLQPCDCRGVGYFLIYPVNKVAVSIVRFIPVARK